LQIITFICYNPTVPPVIFTDFRREKIADTLFDLFKIAIGAVVASKFFMESSKMVQFIGAMVIVALGTMAVFACPPKKPKE